MKNSILYWLPLRRLIKCLKLQPIYKVITYLFKERFNLWYIVGWLNETSIRGIHLTIAVYPAHITPVKSECCNSLELYQIVLPMSTDKIYLYYLEFKTSKGKNKKRFNPYLQVIFSKWSKDHSAYVPTKIWQFGKSTTLRLTGCCFLQKDRNE